MLAEELTMSDMRDIARRYKMIILPVGATEQHGPHLPINTDTLCCMQVAKQVSINTGVPLAPPIHYGHSEEHKGFPGTFYVKPKTLIDMIKDICRSIFESGFKKILIIYGHLPNQYPIECACDDLRNEMTDDYQLRCVRWSAYGSPGYMLSDSKNRFENTMGPHAGAGETSCVLYLRPDLIRKQRIIDESDVTTFFDYNTIQVSKSGISGRPSRANVEEGRKFIESSINQITLLVKRELKEKPKRGHRQKPRRY
jgi:creatinine amidohydrolase